jgi:integrase
LKSVAEARKWRSAFELAAQPIAVRAKDWTVADLAAEWLRDLERSRRVDPSTIAMHELRLRRHLLPEIGGVKVTAVEPLRLVELFAAKLASGLAPGTVSGVQSTAGALFGRARIWGLRPDNPAAGLSRPARPASPGRAWTLAQARLFLERSRLLTGRYGAGEDDPCWPLGWLLLETGMRIGEALTLGWGDLDLGRGVVRVERTLTRDRANVRVVGDGAKTDGSRREIALSAFCVAALERQRERTGSLPFVFPSRTGGLWNAQTPLVWLARRAIEFGLPALRIHDLRHTNATIMRALGIDRDVRAWRLGHRIPGQTAAYEHPDVELQRAAAEAIGRALAGEIYPARTPVAAAAVGPERKRAPRRGKPVVVRRRVGDR